MSDPIVQALFYALVLMLPLSALMSRRVPTATITRYAVAWFLIFGVAFAAIYTLSNTG